MLRNIFLILCFAAVKVEAIAFPAQIHIYHPSFSLHHHHYSSSSRFAASPSLPRINKHIHSGEGASTLIHQFWTFMNFDQPS